MDNNYADTLRDYAAVTYEALHSYLVEGLRYWYDLYSPSQEGGGPMSTKQMHQLRTHVRALSCARTLFRLLLLSTWSSSRRPRARPHPRVRPHPRARPRLRKPVRPRMRGRPRMRVRPGRLLPKSNLIKFNSLP